MIVEAQRHSYIPISFEYYVGGVSSHNTDNVELGQYPFIQPQNLCKKINF
jgi:hypothetical protein